MRYAASMRSCWPAVIRINDGLTRLGNLIGSDEYFGVIV